MARSRHIQAGSPATRDSAS